MNEVLEIMKFPEDAVIDAVKRLSSKMKPFKFAETYISEHGSQKVVTIRVNPKFCVNEK